MATETYKYGGSSDPGAGAGPLILEGSILNPKVSVEIGETVDLSEEQVKEYKALGLKLTKASEADQPPAVTAGDAGTTTAQRPTATTTESTPGSSQGRK